MISTSTTYDAPANQQVLALLPNETRTILDIGCGSGKLAEALQSQEVIVDGVTVSDEECRLAKSRCKRVWLHDLEQGLPKIDSRYDVIVMSHVLEHISNPHKLMLELDEILSDAGCIVCAIPNMLFLYNRLKLLVGKVEYEEKGIMDYTHVRWYTRDSIVELFQQFGFEVDAATDNGNVPLGPVRRVLSKRAQAVLDRVLVNWFPGLLAWEFVFRFKRADLQGQLER